MARTAGYKNLSPYSSTGFVVNGLKEPDGTIHLANLRILKQRSVNLFDIINIESGEVYQKVYITTIDTSTERYLQYTDTDVNLVQKIKENSFFIRNCDPRKNYWGFIIRVNSHKVTIDGSDFSSHYIYKYEVQSDDSPKIFYIQYDPVQDDDTLFSFIIQGQFIDFSDLKIEMILQDGTVFETTAQTSQVIFRNIRVTTPSFTLRITDNDSGYTFTEVIPVQAAPELLKVVTQLQVQSSKWSYDPVSTEYSYFIPESTHQRGNVFAVQAFENPSSTNSDNLALVDTVIDTEGNITIKSATNTAIDLNISSLTESFSPVQIELKEQEWTLIDSEYYYSISSALVTQSYSTYNVWAKTSTGYELVYLTFTSDMNSNIVLKSSTAFDGVLILV